MKKSNKQGVENALMTVLQVLGGLAVSHAAYNYGNKIIANNTARALIPAAIGGGLLLTKSQGMQKVGAGMLSGGVLKVVGAKVPALAGVCGTDDMTGIYDELMNGPDDMNGTLNDDMSGTLNGDDFQISDDMSGSVLNGPDFGREDFSE